MPLDYLPVGERTCKNCDSGISAGEGYSFCAWCERHDTHPFAGKIEDQWRESRASRLERAEKRIAELERERDTEELRDGEDWCKLMQAIAEADSQHDQHYATPPDASDPLFREQYDPWDALRRIKADVERLKAQEREARGQVEYVCELRAALEQYRSAHVMSLDIEDTANGRSYHGPALLIGPWIADEALGDEVPSTWASCGCDKGGV